MYFQMIVTTKSMFKKTHNNYVTPTVNNFCFFCFYLQTIVIKHIYVYIYIWCFVFKNVYSDVISVPYITYMLHSVTK